MAAGAQLETADGNGMTALDHALRAGHADAAALLRDAFGAQLLRAAAEGDAAAVARFIGYGAPLTHCSEEGEPPLLRAAGRGHVKCVEHLINGRADVEAKSNDGSTAVRRECRLW